MGQSIISAYQLPTEIARYDTTSFNVYHHSENGKNGILEFGHSKNHRSDLLQFKQGLATLDPAGVPILSETFAGNRADGPCYLPAWRRMVNTIGKPDFFCSSRIARPPPMRPALRSTTAKDTTFPIADDGRDAPSHRRFCVES